jgi:hypothetical protein
MRKHALELAMVLLLLPAVGLAAEPLALPNAVTTAQLPTDAELDESWARVLLRANPGPFQYCAYEITARGNAGVASHVRGVMGRKDAETRTELLSRQSLRVVMAQLRDLQILEAPHPELPWHKPQAQPAKPLKGKAKAKAAAEAVIAAPDQLWTPDTSDVPVYELSFRFAGKENTFLVADPATQADPRYAEFIRIVRAFAIKSAGEIGYHAPTGDEGRQGYLFVDSVPGAIVTVDGAPLEGETPILAYPVAAGRHTVVLENKLHKLTKEIKVLIQPGVTTSVDIDLR